MVEDARRLSEAGTVRDIAALLTECDRQIAEMEAMRAKIGDRHLAEFDADLALLRNLRTTYELMDQPHAR